MRKRLRLHLFVTHAPCLGLVQTQVAQFTHVLTSTPTVKITAGLSTVLTRPRARDQSSMNTKCSVLTVGGGDAVPRCSRLAQADTQGTLEPTLSRFVSPEGSSQARTSSLCRPACSHLAPQGRRRESIKPISAPSSSSLLFKLWSCYPPLG
jgi:hypothetical protein